MAEDKLHKAQASRWLNRQTLPHSRHPEQQKTRTVATWTARRSMRRAPESGKKHR